MAAFHRRRSEPAAWREIDALIATKRPSDDDRAVSPLTDLRDLGARDGRTAAVAAPRGDGSARPNRS